MENNPIKYKIYSLASSEFPDKIRYIGMTKHLLEKRLKQHIYDSKFICNHRQKWMNSVLEKKYTIIINLLEDNLTFLEAVKKEIELIKLYKQNDNKLTNSTDGGEGLHNPTPEVLNKMSEKSKGNKNRLGAILSEETKNKIRQSHLGKKLSPEHIKKIKFTSTNRLHTPETKEKMSLIHKKRHLNNTYKFPEKATELAKIVNQKAVLQYDLDGKFIDEFESARLAAKKFNLHHGSISNACNKNRKCKNNIWVYKCKFDVIPLKLPISVMEKYEPKPRGTYWLSNNQSEESKNKIRESQRKNMKKVVQLDFKGCILNEFESLHEAYRVTKVSRPSISLCCKCKIQTAGGFKWSYAL
jgi:group I intron endonuclease